MQAGPQPSQKCALSNICILMQAYCVYVRVYWLVCIMLRWCELLTPFAFAAVVVVVHPRGTRADSSNIYIQK